MEKVIVTRHKVLVDHMINMGIISKDTPVIAHATREDIENKHVIGVLPLSLAKYAGAITELPLSIPAELRGKELTLEQLKKFAGEPTTYLVAEIKHDKRLPGDVQRYREFHNEKWTNSEGIEDLLRYGLQNWA